MLGGIVGREVHDTNGRNTSQRGEGTCIGQLVVDDMGTLQSTHQPHNRGVPQYATDSGCTETHWKSCDCIALVPTILFPRIRGGLRLHTSLDILQGSL